MRKVIDLPSSFLLNIILLYVFVKPFYNFIQARHRQHREWLS